MPLRQSLLNFRAFTGFVALASAGDEASKQQTASCSSASSEMGDTIVIPVDVVDMDVDAEQQLPTPSDTSTNVSSHEADYLSTNAAVAKPRLRRTSQRLVKKDRGADQDAPGSRTVSGETLVDEAPSADKDDADMLKDVDASSMLSADTIIAKADDEEPQEEKAVRQAQAEARRAKMEEKKRLREKRYKEADSKATRRSSRASTMLSKAGDVVSGLAATVLGKRKSRVDEQQPKAEKAAGSATAEQDAKRRRLSTPLLQSQTSVAQTAQTIKTRRPKDKKWLTSGLYAGQSSSVSDSHASKSRRKSSLPAALAPIHEENAVLPLPMFAGERLLQTGRDFKLPFDVFSPLPAGQPKPDEWRKSNRNTFVGDAQAEWRTSKFVEQSRCMCTAEMGCGDNCINRFMYYECDETNCNVGPDHCGNRAFADLARRKKKGNKYSIGVEVIKTADRGYGVRSNRTFEPNQIIVEYSGEILTQEECEKRMRREYRDNECYYLMNFDQNMVIDATTKGSIARFVNHSCAPNCRMEKWTVGGQPRMALFAGERGVMTGEELTYDYNFDPYSRKNVQECRCGEDNCRGVLGPKQQQKPSKKEDGHATPPKRKPSKAATTAKSLKRKVLKAARVSTTSTKTAVHKSKARLLQRRKAPQPNLRTPSRKLVQSKAASRVAAATAASTRAISTSSSKTLLERGGVDDGKPRRSTSIRDRVRCMTRRTMSKRVH